MPPAIIGLQMQALQSAAIAMQSFTATVQPVGMLNLERIEMTPAGIERGELIATIPLAPGEETAVTHKEWSVTSTEFTKVVTDELEQVSETGVTDNTDLSQSTNSQNQHGIQFNITGTVQGGIPIINGSSTAAATAQDAISESASSSIRHASTITQKASARSRKEHKITISTKTETGASETSTRMLKNKGEEAIRVDYFSLMRNWRVRLYLYGLRLTYDVVIPEPGAAMRAAYMEIEKLRRQLGPFVFNLKYSDIAPDVVDKNWAPAATVAPGTETKPKYLWLAERHGVAVRPYPSEPSPMIKSTSGAGVQSWSYLEIEFNVPVGVRVREIYLSAIIGKNDGEFPHLRVLGARVEPKWLDQDGIDIKEEKIFAQDGTAFMNAATGNQKVTFWLWHSEMPSITLKIVFETAPDAIEQWRTDVWTAVYNAAQTAYYAQQQDIAGKIAALEDKIANVDTLTLRREESDEIMKCVLKFLLGPEFDLMPWYVEDAFRAEGKDDELNHGVGFLDKSLDSLANFNFKTSVDHWTMLRRHEEIVQFINQAIEWENVITFVYSYFWDIPQSWPFIRQLRHPDATRQAFLRAGSARVVLTVRKGWEEKWRQFVEDLTVDADIGSTRSTGPYMSIAQEIAAYDDRNYPGIPPANPARAAVRLQDAKYTISSAKIDPPPSGGPVKIPVQSSKGFKIGLRVVLDVEDDRHIQEPSTVTEIPDDNHIVVASLEHSHDGTTQPFPVVQPGEKGVLVAEWNEYTPSSGVDIAMTSKLTEIA